MSDWETPIDWAISFCDNPANFLSSVTLLMTDWYRKSCIVVVLVFISKVLEATIENIPKSNI